MKAWLKGALIGGATGLIVRFLIPILFASIFICKFSMGCIFGGLPYIPELITLIANYGFWINTLFWIIAGVIIGIIINIIIEKIKSKQ